MVAKIRKRRGKKPGPKPLPRELKRRRITITLTPKYLKQVAAHKSPGRFVEYCVSLARCITHEQQSHLVDIYLATSKTVDKLVQEAVKGYLGGFGTPNPDNTLLGQAHRGLKKENAQLHQVTKQID